MIKPSALIQRNFINEMLLLESKEDIKDSLAILKAYMFYACNDIERANTYVKQVNSQEILELFNNHLPELKKLNKLS